MSPTSPTIKTWALEAGFTLAGVASAGPVTEPARSALTDYLAQGWHGQMDYLARQVDLRLDASQLLATGARSVICVALNYYHDRPLAATHAIARYARFRDYHDLIKTRLHALADRIRAAAGHPVETRCLVDSGPLLEKYHAWRAGLGWIGKNSLLIHPRLGSWLLLGEIVTDLELEPDSPLADQCGDCRLCLDSCPTQALVGPGRLNASRCLSYWTTERGGCPPAGFQPLIARRGFGCDLCQEACPFNRRPTVTADPDLHPRDDWQQFDRQEVINEPADRSDRHFRNSAMARMVKKLHRPDPDPPQPAPPD